MIQRAIVTGGLGFIGSHVAEALLKQGASVLVIDDLSTGRKENQDAIQKGSGKPVEALIADMGSDEARKAVIDFKPEVVFHLGAQVNVRKSVANPVFDAKTNILGTVNMLDACREAGVKKFLFASTGGAIYGEQESFPADEQHRTRPESQYGVSKRAAELYLEHYAHAYGLGVVSLRFSNVYGPRQNPKGEAGVVAVFTERLLAGEPLRINGDGGQTRDFIFVGDVVRANIVAAENVRAGEFRLYNVGRGVEISVSEVATAARQVWADLMPGREVVLTNGPELPGEQRRSVIDSRKLQKELSWKPETEFSQGIRVTIESFLKK